VTVARSLDLERSLAGEVGILRKEGRSLVQDAAVGSLHGDARRVSVADQI